MAMMVRYLIPDQVLIHIRDKNDEDNNINNAREDTNYDFAVNKKQRIEDKDNSPQPNQTLCSICNRNDRIVTDSESGEIICGNCGMVISDKAEDTSHLERHIFSGGGQIDDTRARTGAPTSLASHDMGLATIVGKNDK